MFGKEDVHMELMQAKMPLRGEVKIPETSRSHTAL